MNNIYQKLAIATAGVVVGSTVLAANSANAAMFSFSQTDFLDISPGAPIPSPPFGDAFLEGIFTGEDSNLDQTIDLSELTDFSAFFTFSGGSFDFTLVQEELDSFVYNLVSNSLTFSGGISGIKAIIASSDETFVGLKMGTLPTLASSTSPVVVNQILPEPEPVPEPNLSLALGLLGLGSLAIKKVAKSV